ncbi:hypothetical protein Tco_1368155 [Tanacetum coccineum]
MVIKKLKERIKSLSGNIDKIKQDIEEIETINIELDHRSVEISDLNACLQEFFLVITTLKDELRKLNGKDLANNEVTHHPSDPEINTELITPKLLNKRKSTTNVPVSKSKVLQSVSTNNKKPSKSWGSKISDVPSSSLNECRSSKLSSIKFGNDHVEKILGCDDYQIGNVTISKVYYVEGLGHNLFPVGQFCDSNLEVAFRQHTYFIHNLER